MPSPVQLKLESVEINLADGIPAVNVLTLFHVLDSTTIHYFLGFPSSVFRNLAVVLLRITRNNELLQLLSHSPLGVSFSTNSTDSIKMTDAILSVFCDWIRSNNSIKLGSFWAINHKIQSIDSLISLYTVGLIAKNCCLHLEHGILNPWRIRQFMQWLIQWKHLIGNVFIRVGDNPGISTLILPLIKQYKSDIQLVKKSNQRLINKISIMLDCIHQYNSSELDTLGYREFAIDRLDMFVPRESQDQEEPHENTHQNSHVSYPVITKIAQGIKKRERKND